MNHNSSARKKLLQYEDDIKKSQVRNNLFQRTLSRQHSKFMQSVLRQNIQKQQSDRVIKKQLSSSRNYQSNSSSKHYQSINQIKNQHNSIKQSNNPFKQSNNPIKHLQQNKTDRNKNIQINQSLKSIESSVVKYKPLKVQKSKNNDSLIRVQDSNNQTQQNNNNLIGNKINQTDQVRSARQNQLLQSKKMPFQFSFLSFSIQLLIAYGVTFSILYLIQVADFPYYQLLLVIALTLTIVPWKISNIIMLITAIPIIITNYYIGLRVLTYFEIFICYIAVMMFNQKYKIKLLFLLVLAIQLIFGFLVFPRLYNQLNMINAGQIYYYIFPLFMFLLRNIVQFLFWVIGYSTGLFLQIPLFLIGLQYGTILSVPVGDIQFWYLIVVFTLQIMNDRTHFFLKIMIDLTKFCFADKRTKTPKNTITINNIRTPDCKEKNNHILPAHWNGFSSINSFHLICCVYIFTQLNLYASPYSSLINLQFYTSTQKYKPLIIWSLASVYQIMCMILKRNKKNVLLYGYTNNRWYHTITRGLTLVLGFWFFYMGLGVGFLATQYKPTQN